MNIALLTHLRKPVRLFWAIAVTVILFDIAYYMMATLPGGAHEYVCEIGGSLTTGNIVFAGVFSVLIGILFTGLASLHSKRKGRMTTLSSLGALFGTLTLFCTICTLPIITFLGISSALALFVDYNIWFKLLSIALLLLALRSLNKQLADTCKSCGPRSVRKLASLK